MFWEQSQFSQSEQANIKIMYTISKDIATDDSSYGGVDTEKVDVNNRTVSYFAALQGTGN